MGTWNGGLGRGVNAASAAGVGNTRYVSEELIVLAEQLLTEVALWSWVVFVLWATPPNHE